MHLRKRLLADVAIALLVQSRPLVQIFGLRRFEPQRGEHLGAALATVVAALDVAEIVLSGAPAVTTETFRDAAHASIVSRTMPGLADRLVIQPGSFGFDDVLVGAAARVLDLELGIR